MPEPLQPPEPPPEQKFSALRGLQQTPKSLFFKGEKQQKIDNLYKSQKKIGNEIREELDKPSQNLGKLNTLQKQYDFLGKRINEEERAIQEPEGQTEEPKEVENVMDIVNEIGKPDKDIPDDTPSEKETVEDFGVLVGDIDATTTQGLGAEEQDLTGFPKPIQEETGLTPMQKSKIGKKKYTEMSYSDFQSEYKTSVPKQKRKQENKRYITSEYTKKRKGTGQHDVWSVVSRFEKERGEPLTFGEIRYITTKMGHQVSGNILGGAPNSRAQQGRKSLEEEGIFTMVDDDPQLR